MKRILNPGSVKIGNRKVSVYIAVEYENERLSITGVEGPLSNGNAIGSCGQIDLIVTDVSAGWTRAMVNELRSIWKRWHLNDMRAGCEHQRAEQWDKQPIDPSKPLNTYGRFFEGQKQDSWNMLAWVSRVEHPKGLLSHPCSVCGYKYGTAWLKESVPSEVISKLESFPETVTKPAWV